jgi:hypothetical protein
VEQLRFERFSTEANFDFVSVYDGSTDASTQLLFSSGSLETLTSTNFASTGPSLLVRLTTDGSVASEGFAVSYGCEGSDFRSSNLLITAPDFNRVLLHGGAVAGTCGLVLSGNADAAEIDPFDYASDGHWTVAVWFNKVSCTTQPWEYLYSHDNLIDSGDIFTDGNANINFLMSCDDQFDGTFIRSVALSDSNGLLTFDWRMHTVNDFQAIEGEWFFYAVAVSPLAVEVSVNGGVVSDEHFFTGLPNDDRKLIDAFEGRLDLSTLRSQYTGASLGGQILIGARAYDPFGTGFKGRIAGVHISSETACASVIDFGINKRSI